MLVLNNNELITLLKDFLEHTPVGLNNTFLHWWIANDNTKEALAVLQKLNEHELLDTVNWFNKKDGRSNTPLSLAVAKKYMNKNGGKTHMEKYLHHDKNLIDFLITQASKEVLLNKDINGNTALHIAIAKRDTETINLLLTKANHLDIDLLSLKNNNEKRPIDMLDITYQEAKNIAYEIYPVSPGDTVLIENDWNSKKEEIHNSMEQYSKVFYGTKDNKGWYSLYLNNKSIIRTNSEYGDLQKNIDKVIQNTIAEMKSNNTMLEPDIKTKALFKSVVEYQQKVKSGEIIRPDNAKEGTKYYLDEPNFQAILQKNLNNKYDVNDERLYKKYHLVFLIQYLKKKFNRKRQQNS